MNALKLFVLSLLSFVVILASNEGQAQAQTGIIWRTQFFNNSFLNGSAVVTRQDPEIAFNWGTGSPAPGVNADNFTARFSTSTYFENKTYRFSIVADDGVKLIIDDSVVIINTFDNPRPSQTLTADIQLSAGQHKLQLDFREVKGDALVYLGWLPVSGNSQPVVIPQQPSAPATIGWTAEYFTNANLSGSPSAIMSVIGPSNNWGSGSPLANIPVDNFSARWTGIMQLEGTYDLTIRADDGIRVFVDGVNYINEWHSAADRNYTARFTVPYGTHRIVIEYYESAGIAYIDYGLIRTASGPVAPQPPQTGAIAWTAQYYNNASMTGSPVLVQAEYGISRNWSNGSPASNVPADYFSARWSSVQPLTAGTYRLTVRADDGVRVNINGVSYINEWHTSNATNNYVTTLNLPTGNHSIVVEYYEETGGASIDYSLIRADNVVNNPSQPSNGAGNARITVTTPQLNVRQNPSITGNVLTRIARDQSYAIIGRNADSSWWQINVNGTVGWVSAFYTSASNIQNVPVTNSNTQINPPATSYTVTTTANVNLRTGAGTGHSVLSVIPRNTGVSILARNLDTTWWQVSYRGVVGWVSAGYVVLQPNTDLNRIPISR